MSDFLYISKYMPHIYTNICIYTYTTFLYIWLCMCMCVCVFFTPGPSQLYRLSPAPPTPPTPETSESVHSQQIAFPDWAQNVEYKMTWGMGFPRDNLPNMGSEAENIRTCFCSSPKEMSKMLSVKTGNVDSAPTSPAGPDMVESSETRRCWVETQTLLSCSVFAAVSQNNVF